MTTTVDSLLAHAANQIGTYERTGRNDVLYSDYYGITGYSWCYAFTQWCFETDGAELPFKTMYVPAGVAWSRENGQSVERGSPPQPGDIVHFTWSMSEWPPDRAGTGDHVGIVESWNGADTLTTIEGNVGSPQGVYRMRRSISATVINYWRPPVYTDGGFGIAGTVDPAPATKPSWEDDEIMRQYRDVSNGTVYAVFGCFKCQLESDAVRQAWETMGVLAPKDQYFDQSPGVMSEFVLMNQDTFASMMTGINNSYANLAAQHAAGMDAIRAIPLAHPVDPTMMPAAPVVDVKASLRQATLTELAAELTARAK